MSLDDLKGAAEGSTAKLLLGAAVSLIILLLGVIWAQLNGRINDVEQRQISTEKSMTAHTGALSALQAQLADLAARLPPPNWREGDRAPPP